MGETTETSTMAPEVGTTIDEDTKEEGEAMIRAYVKKYVLPKHLDVDEEDAVTLLTLLAQTGMLNPSRLSENQPKSTFAKPRRFDLKEAAYFDCEGPSRCNNRKRITYVRLGNWDTPVWNFHTEQVFQLLSRLECLETLCLDRCQSFRLTETIGRSVLSDDGSIIGPLNIGSLNILQHMQVPSRLEALTLSGSTMESEANLAIFLFDIFPFLPNLTTFRTVRNNVQSFQQIADRIRNNQENELQKANNCRLRLLDLGELPHGIKPTKAKFANDQMEIKAVKTVLDAFSKVNNICGFLGLESCRQNYEYLDPTLAYQMEVNFAGRALLVEVNNNETEDSGAVASSEAAIAIAVIDMVHHLGTNVETKSPFYHVQECATGSTTVQPESRRNLLSAPECMGTPRRKKQTKSKSFVDTDLMRQNETSRGEL
eukprot:CAMPEP_0197264286 /NCGR_PEP_ID=MMETSP1432-20130617/1704_1 /TAXON_ID=44447 /ORGANISM="Pseudo-nitzschia delicatissima, Strain UNC1205" /LENGTH=426 /DNA_ID=CAMNT_0042728917 /DNA_START=47 /DNA_END=1328 /DNA_ORIENTATION=+